MLSGILAIIVDLYYDINGQGLSEYGLIIGIVSIIAAVGLELLGFNIGNYFMKISEYIVSFVGGL